MPGQASASVLTVEVADARAQAVAPGRAITVLDARPPALFSLAEEDDALEQLARKAGPATAGIVRRVATAFESYRCELNQTAGGQASDHVMLLAHNAQRAQVAVELQTSISAMAHGSYVANDGDKGQAEKGLHRLVGICAFATDLLNKARDAAREEGKAATGSATDQLMSRLGVTATASAQAVPDDGSGGGSLGAPGPTEFAPPIPPNPGGSK
jgi:hypothetical protein